MTRELRGRKILISGASRGIGRGLAEQLATRGAKLALAARSADVLAGLASKLSASGATVVPLAADVTDPTQRENLVRDAVDKLGGLDVLINNAGVASFGHFASSSEAVLRTIMEVNFFAPAELIRLAAPHLMKGNQPAVVNVASVCGRRALPVWSEHSASKYALVGLSEALRGEFVRFGIDVLVVLPGLVRSDDLGRHLLRNEGRMDMKFEKAQPAHEVAAAIVRALENNRAETPVGWQARWLSRANRWLPRFVDRMMARKVRQLYS